MFFDTDEPLLPRVPVFLYEICPNITWSIHVLFFIVVSHASVMFDCLSEKLRIVLNTQISWQIETWRQNHVLVCQLVDNINLCFGVVLLVSVSFYFISFTTNSYRLYNALTYSDGGHMPTLGLISHLIVITIKDIFHLLLLVTVSYQMQRKVSAFFQIKYQILINEQVCSSETLSTW